MKIFEFSWGIERDWVFAPNEKKAKSFYLGFTGNSDLEGCEVTEVPKEKWNEMYLLDINEMEPDEDEEYNEDEYYSGYKIIETFAEYAERETTIDLIATTEF